MATKEFKSQKIEYYKKQFENAKVAVVADYRGLSVEEITELRRALQSNNADLTVTKNTLLKVAAKGSSFEVVLSIIALLSDTVLAGHLDGALNEEPLSAMNIVIPIVSIINCISF